MASIQARVPGASVTTAPATRPNQSKPLTALATSSAVASSHWPVSRPRPRGDDAALDHHDRHAVEERLDAVLAHGGVDAAAVDARAGGAWTCGVAAASLTVRTDSSADTSDWPKRARAVEAAAAERPATRRPSVEARAEATITASRTAPASQVPAMSGGQRRDERAR